MKKILGLDLGTNSIGWALIDLDFENKNGRIQGLGSRIIPMSQDILGKFDSGVSISQTAERTGYRAIRRLYQRAVLRRERLHRVLKILGFLPEHYSRGIDFINKPGQFKNGAEIKINYRKCENEKDEFIFKESFNEMVFDFKKNGYSSKIPYDWTIYYLRKKALTKKILKEELAWIILNFNTKRGYYQLRGENEDDGSKIQEYVVLTVKELIDSGNKTNGKSLYDVVFTNGWKYPKQIVKVEEWQGKTKEFIVTTTFDKNGELKKNKDGTIIRSFKKVDAETDWIAIKKKTEQDLDRSLKTVGEYIYDAILENPSQKIKGTLIRTIERKFYKKELTKILEIQSEFHPELKDINLYKECINELYPKNLAQQNFLNDKDFIHLFINDIIFYQRPLKSKKSSISNCQYEYKTYKNDKGVLIRENLKAIPKSHPLFQEFRLWQFIRNLRVYQKSKEVNGKSIIDFDVTLDLFPDEKSWAELFNYLNSRKEIEQKQFMDYLIQISRINKSDKNDYRWNYVEDKKYPCNETRYLFKTRLNKIQNIDSDNILSPEFEKSLWHLIYSITDKIEFEKALKTFARKHDIEVDAFVENFKNFPPFKSDYGSYSHKAINRLLPLMRQGKYWIEENVPQEIKEQIDAIIERLKVIDFDKKQIDDTVADDDIPKQLLKSFADFKYKCPYKGLNTYQACYAVYGRHSESDTVARWKKPDDINKYLIDFKQHSLRNPIVEQVVTETLRVVKDIWEYYGNGDENFFDEIHLELGREMKNPAKVRQDLTKKMTLNENTNQRIRELLKELNEDNRVSDDVRPYSSSHQELLKIYEEGIYQNPETDYSQLSMDDVEKIRKNANPSKSEIVKYKLWLEQGYISPYTGQAIQLSRLFSTDFQIEHIIPQSRYFDDSLSNKVICESEINQLKSNQTAYEFIKNEKGRIVPMANGNTVKLFSLEEYEDHCNKYFSKNRKKLKKLLSEDIPEGFIERQMNDSRYISKLVKGLLSNIVRNENEVEPTSQKLLPVTGAITSKLKQDWGLNDNWNEIIAPRFKRLNEITKSNNFGFWDNSINAFRPTVPDELAKGFSKKRIDHRHHALDALVIACTTREHVHYLNALNAENENFALREKLLIKNKQGHFTRHFSLPWTNFSVQAKNILEKTVISFKQNQRIINKTNNRTWQWVPKNGAYKKELVTQTKGDNWAIRKPLHKETVSGKVKVRNKKTVSFSNGIKDWENLVDKTLKNKIRKLIKQGLNQKQIAKYFKDNPYPLKQNKVEVYSIIQNAYASRIDLTEKFTRKQLDCITDSGIKNILENHLLNYVNSNGKENFSEAFSSKGIEELNKNIVVLNKGKFHQPIFKVRIYETGNKFAVGVKGNKQKKFVEAAKGTNLFFAIYWNEEKQKREFETIPLNVVIAHQKWRATLPKEEQQTIPLIPYNNIKGKFLFYLSPNDLVYVPTQEELDNPGLIDFDKLSKEQSERIYKMVSCTGNQCFFIQNHVATPIYNKFEFSALNKMEKSINNEMIKEYCVKIDIDRIGLISKVRYGNELS